MRERGIRPLKCWPLWWTFEDPQMEDLYSELCMRAACRRMQLMAIVLFCIAVLAAAFNLPSGAVRFGTRYFSGLQAWVFYLGLSGPLITLVGTFFEKRGFRRKTFAMPESTGPRKRKRGKQSFDNVVLSDDVEQGGRDPQSSVSAVAPTVGSSPGGTNKEKSSTEESRTLRGVQGGGGDADENLGRGSRGGQSGSSEKRWASRDEWVKWKGASMEKEVRLHWRTRFYLGLIGTIVLSGAGFIHWVLSFRAPELTGDTVYSQVQTSQSVPSAVASMAVLYVTAESLKDCLPLCHIWIAVFYLFVFIWDIAMLLGSDLGSFLILSRQFVFIATIALVIVSTRNYERSSRQTLAILWESRKNANLAAETTKELSLQQRFTMSQGLFFQKIVHDLKTPLWSITHAFESVRDLWNIRDGIGCGFAMDKGGSGEKDGHGVRTGKEKEKDAQPDSGEPQLLRQGERCSLCQDREEIWPILQGGLASTVYMKNLAMNLLEVARLKFAGGSGDSEGGGDEGTVDLACGISSVLRCLESVGVMMKPAGAVKGVDVKVVDSRPYLAEKFGTLEGIAWFDETRLSQAVTNGISNGVKYTRGGGSVTVLLSDRVLSEEQRQGAPLTGDIEGEGGKEPAEMMIPFDPLKNEEAEALISAAGLMIGEPRRLVIEIRDTGRGIPQNKMSEIWSEYHQVQKQDAAVGSGLGLSIVRAIMRAMGGSADIFSKEGEGTSLYLSFFVRALVPRTVLGDSFGSRASLAMQAGWGGRSQEGGGEREDRLSSFEPEGGGSDETENEHLFSLRPRVRLSLQNQPKRPSRFGMLRPLQRPFRGGGQSEPPVRGVWENLQKHVEVGRKDLLWEGICALSSSALSTLLVQEFGAVIVLVDDQPMMLRVLGDITKKVGFPPKRTLSYDEPEVAAVNVVALVGGPLPKGTNAPPIEEARAVLLLTDMQMGDMSGLALGRQVRKEAVEAGAIVGPFPPPPARSASQELSQLKGEVSPLGYAAPPLYPGDPRMGGMGEFVCSFSRTDSGGSRLLDPQARHSKRASGVSVDGRSPTIIEFERDVSPASAGAGPLNRDTSGSPPTSSARKKRVPPDSELPELRIRAASIPSPKTPMQTAGAEVQWAVRVSAPASPQPCVLRCCLLSAQIRGGILERHPEAETVMDAVLEKPLYADGLIQQLRELAAAVLWTGRKRKTGASAEDVEVELH